MTENEFRMAQQEANMPGSGKMAARSMTDPVDDFARGPEVRFGHENDRWEIRKEGVMIPMDEILSVLKPFAEEAGRHSEEAPDYRTLDEPVLNLHSVRAARDLYLKLGGVL